MKKQIKNILFVLAVATTLVNSQIVAGFQRDFNATTPSTGWRYLWNASGASGDLTSNPIGNPAAYSSLLSDGTYYTPDGDSNLTNNAPSDYLVLGPQGGHLTNDSAAPDVRRYMIFEYTIQTTGFYNIQDSYVQNAAAAFGQKDVGFRLNSGPRIASLTVGTGAYDPVTNPGGRVTFDSNLGALNAGDKLYLELGSIGSNSGSSFNMDYNIVAVPEPSTYAMIFGSVLLGILVIRKKRIQSA